MKTYSEIVPEIEQGEKDLLFILKKLRTAYDAAIESEEFSDEAKIKFNEQRKNLNDTELIIADTNMKFQ